MDFVIESIIKVVVVFVVVLLSVAYSTLLERKLLGWIQQRHGPNRVGPWGLLQPLADGLKFFFKEDVVPGNVDKLVYIIAPVISLVPALLIVAVIPFGAPITVFGREVTMQITDMNMALLYIIGLSGVGAYGGMLGGWASNNRFGLLGSMRSAAQGISYELGMGLTLVSIILLTGTMSLAEIVAYQQDGWLLWKQPVAFVLFIICGLAEINRAPFDMPEAESELACGFNIEYSSMKFALFFMAEYAHTISLAAIITCLFLGGWNLFGLEAYVPPVLIFLGKVFCLIFFFIWERGTFPRLRYDQIMNLGWKWLMPIAILNLIVTAGVVIAMS
ncbi:MAG: NADH-quinone oxidoreductase subunit NuoH [Deltaproteobacteria bacterium]|nr:MAG: NADH-quinone oxidoreductase subunit NuoH [Deltaproteobacteria bacterium]